MKRILVLMSLLFSLAACQRSHPTLPTEFLGTWPTDEPVYQGKSLKLESEYILVGFGQDINPTVQKISKVELLRDGTSEAATIFSTDREGPHQLTVYYEPAGGTVSSRIFAGDGTESDFMSSRKLAAAQKQMARFRVGKKAV